MSCTTKALAAALLSLGIFQAGLVQAQSLNSYGTFGYLPPAGDGIHDRLYLDPAKFNDYYSFYDFYQDFDPITDPAYYTVPYQGGRPPGTLASYYREANTLRGVPSVYRSSMLREVPFNRDLISRYSTARTGTYEYYRYGPSYAARHVKKYGYNYDPWFGPYKLNNPQDVLKWKLAATVEGTPLSNPYGTNLSGANPYGTNPYGTNPHGTLNKNDYLPYADRNGQLILPRRPVPSPTPEVEGRWRD